MKWDVLFIAGSGSTKTENSSSTVDKHACGTHRSWKKTARTVEFKQEIDLWPRHFLIVRHVATISNDLHRTLVPFYCTTGRRKIGLNCSAVPVLDSQFTTVQGSFNIRVRTECQTKCLHFIPPSCFWLVAFSSALFPLLCLAS